MIIHSAVATVPTTNVQPTRRSCLAGGGQASKNQLMSNIGKTLAAHVSPVHIIAATIALNTAITTTAMRRDCRF